MECNVGLHKVIPQAVPSSKWHVTSCSWQAFAVLGMYNGPNYSTFTMLLLGLLERELLHRTIACVLYYPALSSYTVDSGSWRAWHRLSATRESRWVWPEVWPQALGRHKAANLAQPSTSLFNRVSSKHSAQTRALYFTNVVLSTTVRS